MFGSVSEWAGVGGVVVVVVMVERGRGRTGCVGVGVRGRGGSGDKGRTWWSSRSGVRVEVWMGRMEW